MGYQQKGSFALPLLHRLSTVNDHGVPNHEGSRVRAQPNNCRSNLLRLAHPSNRLLRNHLRSPFVRAAREATHHGGVNVARTNGVDANVLCGVVEGGPPGESNAALAPGSELRS